MCAILYSLDNENLYWFDSISVVLLTVSVFLVNGKFAEYYIERIFAVVTSFALWFSLGIMTGWPEGTLMFSLLFAMYFVVDLYRTIVFYASARKEDSDKIKNKAKYKKIEEDRNRSLPN